MPTANVAGDIVEIALCIFMLRMGSCIDVCTSVYTVVNECTHSAWYVDAYRPRHMSVAPSRASAWFSLCFLALDPETRRRFRLWFVSHIFNANTCNSVPFHDFDHQCAPPPRSRMVQCHQRVLVHTMLGGFDKRSQCVRPTTKKIIWNVFMNLNDDCIPPLHKQWNVFLWIGLFYGCCSWRTNSVAALTSLANPCCQSNLFKRHRKHCPSMHEVRSNMGRYRIRYATRLKCTGVCCWHVLWNIEQHRPHIMSYVRSTVQSPAAFFSTFNHTSVSCRMLQRQLGGRNQW